MEGNKQMQALLNMTQIEFLEYCIKAMKDSKLDFMFFDITEIEDVEKTKNYFEADGYKVELTKETFKVFWDEKTNN